MGVFSKKKNFGSNTKEIEKCIKMINDIAVQYYENIASGNFSKAMISAMIIKNAGDVLFGVANGANNALLTMKKNIDDVTKRNARDTSEIGLV